MEKNMEKNEQMLKSGSFPQLAINLCVPTILIMLVMVVYNMADTYFIGKTGDPCKIAAVSLCAPVFSILSGLGTLLGSGGCTVVSLSLGKKEYAKIKACTSLCCYVSLTIGLLFSAAVLMNLAGISNAIGANEDTLEYTCTYLKILAFGGPVILFGNVFNNLIRADGSAKQAMISNGLGTIANIILDPILILGFHMGVAGAAAATVIGNVISFLYLLWYITKKQKAFSLNIRSVREKRGIPANRDIGTSTGMQYDHDEFFTYVHESYPGRVWFCRSSGKRCGRKGLNGSLHDRHGFVYGSAARNFL